MSDRITVAHWREIETHLNERLAALHVQIERADSDRELWELKGRAKQVRELLGLPQTLTVLQGAP